MDREALIKSIQKLRPALEAEGVMHVAIFGSRARGDFRLESDIDMLLEIDPERKFSLLDLIGIEHLVSDSTGLSANAILKRGLDSKFSKSISSDVVNVF